MNASGGRTTNSDSYAMKVTGREVLDRQTNQVMETIETYNDNALKEDMNIRPPLVTFT